MGHQRTGTLAASGEAGLRRFDHVMCSILCLFLCCFHQIELNPREISLMTAGACGAFVHGLEDEFMGKGSSLLSMGVQI